MRFPPVRLTPEQRSLVETALRELCSRYDWTIHSLAAQSDHVHIVVTAPREGEALRDALKAVASKHLNMAHGVRPWWAEKGSAKYLWEPDYFRNAVAHVTRQRDEEPQ